jgi:hypothetical protein
MSKLLMSLLIAAGAMGTSATALADPITKDQYKATLKQIDADYKADKQNCAGQSGNARDICKAEATGKKNVAKADAEAAYKTTDKARTNAQIARADATYDVNKEKCDDQSGNAKSVCKKDAKAAYVKAKADAKAGLTSRDARKDAATDANDAAYAAAKQRCDALSSDAKTKCQNDAKVRYGKA